jgi:hypothetical protein
MAVNQPSTCKPKWPGGTEVLSDWIVGRPNRDWYYKINGEQLFFHHHTALRYCMALVVRRHRLRS